MKCIRLKSTIPVKTCLAYQERNHAACVECPDGERARSGMMNDDDVNQLKEQYVMEQTTTKVCTVCKKEKPVHEFWDTWATCKECGRARQKAYKEKKRMEMRAEYTTKESSSAKPIDITPKPTTATAERRQLFIDFSDFPEVWDALKRKADEEMRPLEWEARWLLKEAVK